ncbi:HAMP domain-containing sensor histidine kinase [Mucilaginibacter jinjuensis]|uniref:histidine kinase n=1 Tax=Mucilaginibacter jinjuensis TaxID=1176721 RepID=A0ABY7TDQ1_9SPHI|nr:HAMP domain-containing sensor histidine kinase [Mucilaginibacter jinjuensis]WCT14274.1 HAMP domain-containing sensor histidine kinase [Mucilaginibacter jinjuensis]
MKTRSTGIFSRIGIFIFLIIASLAILFVYVTYSATSDYYQASTQLLNKDIASRIATLSSPFSKEGIDHKKADSVFKNTMIISPNTEVYFLDTMGNVKYYFAPDSLIKQRKVPVDKIEAYLNDHLHLIKNIDPRDPDNPKIFSAAPVMVDDQNIGYIYVILVSKEYRNVAEFVFKSQVGGWATKGFFLLILVTVIFSFLYTSRLQKRYNNVIHILNQFRDGNLNVRFDVVKKDDFFPIADAFNRMVAMLDSNFSRLKLLEDERKNFLANISHDLRTPLAVARGYTETLLIESDIDKAAQESYLEMVLNKILQVEKLVLQVFELSRMDAVNFEPKKEPFIFSEILQENIKGAEFQAKKKNIQIVCENCEDNSWVNADINMMERVIQNLLENAVKYAPDNGIIKISLARGPEKLIVQLENSGQPLPNPILSWVNDLSAEDALHRPKEAGLGLALVKRILRLHNFSFFAKTSDEKFNCFTISIDNYKSSSKKV